MSDPDMVVALVTTGGGLLSAIVAEAIRRHRAQRDTDRRLDAVLHEITPNDGQSMHDKINRIEKTIERVRQKQSDQGERLAAVEARVNERAESRRR